MKWGVRKDKIKDREIALRNKLTNISNNKDNINKSDLKRIAYRNQNVGVRISKTVSSVVKQQLLSEIITGKAFKYGSMDEQQLKAHLSKRSKDVAKHIAKEVLVREMLSKSASNKYTEAGEKIDGKQSKGPTREDLYAKGIDAGQKVIKAAPALRGVLALKAQQARDKRYENEATYNKWGGKALNEAVVWASEDGKTVVLERQAK